MFYLLSSKCASILSRLPSSSRPLSVVLISHRGLKLMEYQSMTLLRNNNCLVPEFAVLSSPEAKIPKEEEGQSGFVLKAQVLAGGRGKGRFIDANDKNLGGVFMAKSLDEAHRALKEMMNQRLVTKQTGPEGVLVKKVMIAKPVKVLHPAYLAFLHDREHSSPVAVACPEGGVNIEEVVAKQPELVHVEPIDVERGITEEQTLGLAKFLGFGAKEKAAAQIKKLYEVFIEYDATLLEINPLSEASDGKVYCLDAKMIIDDSALPRQKEITAFEGERAQNEEMDNREKEADQFNLNYIPLDGEIACVVNGAGLAMATMDLLKLHGGEPANFLDVGGTVNEEEVFHAFKIITENKRVRAIFVNIFGGIVNCETIAKGLIQAWKRLNSEIPLVVRLAGTNAEEAHKLLEESSLPIHYIGDLDEAAKLAVVVSREYMAKRSQPKHDDLM